MSRLKEGRQYKLGGSYPILSTPEKQSRVHYTGLDGPHMRKKNKMKDGAKNKYTPNDIVQKVNDIVLTREADTPVARPLTTDVEAPNELHTGAAGLLQPGSPLSVSEFYLSPFVVKVSPPSK